MNSARKYSFKTRRNINPARKVKGETPTYKKHHTGPMLIAYKKDNKKRAASQSRRMATFFKKGKEFSITTGAEVEIKVKTQSKQHYFWNSNEIDESVSTTPVPQASTSSTPQPSTSKTMDFPSPGHSRPPTPKAAKSVQTNISLFKESDCNHCVKCGGEYGTPEDEQRGGGSDAARSHVLTGCMLHVLVSEISQLDNSRESKSMISSVTIIE